MTRKLIGVGKVTEHIFNGKNMALRLNIPAIVRVAMHLEGGQFVIYYVDGDELVIVVRRTLRDLTKDELVCAMEALHARGRKPADREAT